MDHRRRRPSRRVVLIAGLGLLAVIGGTGALVVLGLVSISDPGTFTATGSMSAPRVGHSATLLADGRVLIAGGESPNPDGARFTRLSSAELYDPLGATFSTTGSMTTTRVYATAALLDDGRVLIVGGTSDRDASVPSPAPAEVYDPRTGTFSETGAMTTPRWNPTATLLADGRVLIAGGTGPEADSSSELSSAELYDPQRGTFSATGSMAVGRSGAVATLLPDGRVLVAGGSIPGSAGASADTASAELYDPLAGTFSATGSMTRARLVPAVTLLEDGRVLIAGGWSYASITGLSSAELFDPTSGTFARTASMSTGRRIPTATLLRDGRVLIVDGNGSSLVELYDPRQGRFDAAGAMTTPRLGPTATLLANGRVLIAGGQDTPTTALSTAELFSHAGEAVRAPAASRPACNIGPRGCGTPPPDTTARMPGETSR